MRAGACHSLHAPVDDLPGELAITARNTAGLVMALRHRALPVAAVQFHPGSILGLGAGHTLIANVLATLVRALARRATNAA